MSVFDLLQFMYNTISGYNEAYQSDQFEIVMYFQSYLDKRGIQYDKTTIDDNDCFYYPKLVDKYIIYLNNIKQRYRCVRYYVDKLNFGKIDKENVNDWLSLFSAIKPNHNHIYYNLFNDNDDEETNDDDKETNNNNNDDDNDEETNNNNNDEETNNKETNNKETNKETNNKETNKETNNNDKETNNNDKETNKETNDDNNDMALIEIISKVEL